MIQKIVKFISGLGLILLLAASSSQVLAHVLVVDGTIGTVLHVNPEDDPIAGQPTDMYFEFKDTSQKLQLEKCQCEITIEQGGNKIFEKIIEPTDIKDNNVSLQYTFLQKGIYTIVIKGQPNSTVNQQELFNPFSLRYDLRVDKIVDGFVATTTNAVASSTGFSLGYFFSEHGFHILIFGAAFVVGIVLTLADKSKKKINK